LILFYFSQILFIGLFNVNFFSLFSTEIEPIGITQHLISLFIGIFSILLLLLSISAYRKTGLKNILYATGAFGLFAIRLFIESFDEIHDVLDDNKISFLNSFITLAILILFFLAIIKRNKYRQ
jgi:hypothetical protein